MIWRQPDLGLGIEGPRLKQGGVMPAGNESEEVDVCCRGHRGLPDLLSPFTTSPWPPPLPKTMQYVGHAVATQKNYISQSPLQLG